VDVVDVAVSEVAVVVVVDAATKQDPNTV
jgi:hypothetical protein